MITLKRVNRTVKVNQDARVLKVKRINRNIKVNQVGRQGIQGEPGLDAVGFTTITVSNTEPSNPSEGDLWVDTN